MAEAFFRDSAAADDCGADGGHASDPEASTDEEFVDALDREVRQLEREGLCSPDDLRRPLTLDEARREVETAAEEYERRKAEEEAKVTEEPLPDVEAEEDDDDQGERTEPGEDPVLVARRKREEAMSQEELEHLKSESLELKKEGNELYAADSCADAVDKYSQALERCPLCYGEERAVFHSNRAAARVRMASLDEALEDCNEALKLKPGYLKAHARRGQIFEDLDKPHEALTDFQKVLELDKDHREARKAVQRLPAKIAKKDEEIKQEMFTNLKKLGNMVLNPFGLSTENFNFVQDPNSGSYSVQFNQNQPNNSNS